MKSHIIPDLLEAWSFPKPHFLQNDLHVPNIVLEPSPNVLEPQINPTLNNPFPHVQSNLVAPSHDRFYSLNSLSLYSKYGHINIFSKD